MKLELSDLREVALEDASAFREHYRRFPPEHSDYLHGTMYTWRDYMRYFFTKTGEHLVITAEHDGRHYIRPPVGPYERDVFEEVIQLSRSEGWEPVISMIGTRTIRWMQKEFPDLTYEPHRDYFEYVYLSRDLVELPGKDHLKVRNYLNKFRKNNEHTIEEISKDNVHEVREFLIEWCEKKGCRDDPLLLHERQANFHALEDMFPLGLEGLMIRVNGEAEAFSMYEEMSREMAVVHHEKANPDIVGIYQAINNETARHLVERYRFINREADMGVEGLRRAKERYRPHHLLEIHHAR
ncbi:MAG: DUF2156 domain-containing protein [Candidatus Thermoplasmatota archaeon]|nr:DUF2156 domain-containing protein [Candidatus Thermoplasmatota archaeon]